MVIKEKKTTLQKRLAVILGTMSMVLCFCLPSVAQQQARGTITGTVTSNQGKVIGFRVAAHNLDRRLWYIVFTNKGHYTVPQALPGRYEVMVDEPMFDSPTIPVQLGPGDTKTVDVALQQQDESVWKAANGDGNLDHRAAPNAANAAAAKLVYVNTMEEMYPPGPALGLLKEDCTGCHGNGFGARHYTKEQFLEGIERATETGPGYNENVIALGRTVINKSQKEMLADYLVKNFGPGVPVRALRVDPLVPDESVVSKQIYVTYDIPEDLPFIPGGDQLTADQVDGVYPQMSNRGGPHHLQEVFISPVDGNVWVTCFTSNSLLRLNPMAYDSAERWKNYPIKGALSVQAAGITIDNNNHYIGRN